MALHLTRQPAPRPLGAPSSGSFPGDCEATVFCPACKTFETMWFFQGQLVATQRFTQQGPRLYHDCGSARPCRVYRPV
jgi:hypothetical protein